MVKYQSTRGGDAGLTFSEAVMKGLASDGGLVVPESVEAFTQDEVAALRSLPYTELAHAIFSRFIPRDEISSDDLKALITKSYSTFRTNNVVQVERLDSERPLFLLELFHGPTFSFKDVALQWLGNLFEYLLSKSDGKTITVLGATSGDTGSAAIQSLRGKKNVTVFMLHPKNRVTRIQELQMTTVDDENVFNVSVEGTFDDCQATVKELFNDHSFNDKVHLAAVNSINWARIMAQICYYFYAAFRIADSLGTEDLDAKKVCFCVPTGNFGDVLAGHFAKRLGLPVAQLVACTNQNNILHGFFSRGEYHKKDVRPSYSPAMDIQVASNLERYLHYLAKGDAGTVREWMDDFASTGKLTLDQDVMSVSHSEFCSTTTTEEQTVETIREFASEPPQGSTRRQYLMDPHTAVAMSGVRHSKPEFVDKDQVVCVLSTAHPAKFGEVVEKATGENVQLPPGLAELASLPTRCIEVPNSVDAVRRLVLEKLNLAE